MKTTTHPRRTPKQQAAMEEAAGIYLGRLPHGLSPRTVQSLMDKRYVYEGDVRGRPLSVARMAGYTGFPQYFLTRTAYAALGRQIHLLCSQCGRGTYAARTGEPGVYWCTAECGQEITLADLTLEPGEYAELRHWRLAVLWREPRPTGEPGTDAGPCDQCGNPVIWDGTGRRVNDERGEYWCPSTRREAGRNPQGSSVVHVVTGPAAEQPEAAVVDAAPAAAEQPAAPVEYLQPLAAAVEVDGLTYHPDGAEVIRLFPAEGNPGPYQTYCPCCGIEETGTTAGMVIIADEPAPLQRVHWKDGTRSNWPVDQLRRTDPGQIRATIGAPRPAFEQPADS